MRIPTAVLVSALTLFASRGLLAESSDPADIAVELAGVANDDGAVRCGLYEESNWLESDRALQWVDAEETDDGSRVCRFEGIEPGTYGVGAFHDADADHDIDSNLFGIPTEGVCVSNDPEAGMGPPSFDGAEFDHGDDETSVPCTMRY